MSDPQQFDPEGPASLSDGIFGLGCFDGEARIILQSVPFDATASSRRGAARGPQAIFEASLQVDLFDTELGEPYREGICMVQEPTWLESDNQTARQAVDELRSAGHPTDHPARATVNELGEAINNWLYDEARERLRSGCVFGVVGGDHSVPFGSIRAHAEQFPGMGVLHLDAHADLRRAYEGLTWSHASIMHNVIEQLDIATLVQVGVRDLSLAEHARSEEHPRIHTFFDNVLARRRLQGESFSNAAAEIVATLPDQVYISFDIDGLDPSLCPNTGTPVPGGLSFHEVRFLIQAVIQSGRRVVGFDLCEVAPSADGSSIDGNVAARVLYGLCGAALAGS